MLPTESTLPWPRPQASGSCRTTFWTIRPGCRGHCCWSPAFPPLEKVNVAAYHIKVRVHHALQYGKFAGASHLSTSPSNAAVVIANGLRHTSLWPAMKSLSSGKRRYHSKHLRAARASPCEARINCCKTGFFNVGSFRLNMVPTWWSFNG